RGHGRRDAQPGARGSSPDDERGATVSEHTNVAALLDELAPAQPVEEPAWEDVLARHALLQAPTDRHDGIGATPGRVRGRRRRPRTLVIAVAAVVTVAVVASALAATGADPLGAFRSWVAGSPGRPASMQAQRQFLAANGRSWAAFPSTTRLRVLIRTTVG